MVLATPSQSLGLASFKSLFSVNLMVDIIQKAKDITALTHMCKTSSMYNPTCEVMMYDNRSNIYVVILEVFPVGCCVAVLVQAADPLEAIVAVAHPEVTVAPIPAMDTHNYKRSVFVIKITNRGLIGYR